jgi:hypothetical protein
MAERKSYSDPSRDTGGRESGRSSEGSPDRDREKNLGSRHPAGSSSEKTGSSDLGESSSDRDRER